MGVYIMLPIAAMYYFGHPDFYDNYVRQACPHHPMNADLDSYTSGQNLKVSPGLFMSEVKLERK